MKKIKRKLAFVLAVIFIGLNFTGCEKGDPDIAELPTSSTVSDFTHPKEYSDIYKALSAITDEAVYNNERSDMAVESSELSLADSSSMAAGSAGYSETNVQVQGVDEGDIVKTDGEYIYKLRDSNEIVISKASGAETQVISRINFSEGEEYVYANEMYISGNLLGFLVNSYDLENTTRLIVYDVSNREEPQFLYETAQDGSYTTSRLIGEKLYVFSSYGVYNADEDKPETYVPQYYDSSGTARLLGVEDIAIIPDVSTEIYTVLTATHITSGDVLSAKTVLGSYGSMVYVTEDSAYLTFQRYHDGAGESYTESVYTVTDYESRYYTDIVHIDLTNDTLNIKGEATVEGYFNDQFAIDEYNGYLRLVLTDSRSKYSIYEDKDNGFINYKYDEENTTSQTNSLIILDESLEEASSITSIAEDELVYSARFDGDIGYFVTYKQVDPLFAVDLSDPQNPQILSELKIPGFSEYLHTYSDGRLLGLGYGTEESESGNVTANKLKLSMFDTADPKNVTEKHTLILEESYSDALYNHNAILVSVDKNVIAFPTTDGYSVYGYSDEDGFYIRGKINNGEMSYNSRGLYIDSFAYVVDDSGITVMNLDDLTKAGYIAF